MTFKRHQDLTKFQDLAGHYNDVTMTTIASQVTSLTVVYSIVHSGADQRKHQSSASLAFERGIHRRPLNSPHKGPVTRKMFQFDDVIMDFFYSVTCLGWEIVTFWFVCMAFSKSLLPMYIIELVWFNCTCNQIFPAIMQSLVNEPDCLFNSLSSG